MASRKRNTPPLAAESYDPLIKRYHSMRHQSDSSIPLYSSTQRTCDNLSLNSHTNFHATTAASVASVASTRAFDCTVDFPGAVTSFSESNESTSAFPVYTSVSASTPAFSTAVPITIATLASCNLANLLPFIPVSVFNVGDANELHPKEATELKISKDSEIKRKGKRTIIRYQARAPVVQTQKRGGMPIEREHELQRPAKRFKTKRPYDPLPVDRFAFTAAHCNILPKNAHSFTLPVYSGNPLPESIKAIKARVLACSQPTTVVATAATKGRAQRRLTDFFGDAPLSVVGRTLGELHLERKRGDHPPATNVDSPTSSCLNILALAVPVRTGGGRGVLTPVPTPTWKRINSKTMTPFQL